MVQVFPARLSLHEDTRRDTKVPQQHTAFHLFRFLCISIPGIRGRLGDHQNLGSVTVKLVRRLPDWSRSVGGKRESTRMSAVSEENDESLPQVWASYISTKKELVPAIVEVGTFTSYPWESCSLAYVERTLAITSLFAVRVAASYRAKASPSYSNAWNRCQSVSIRLSYPCISRRT